MPETVTARRLHGGHIGELVEFAAPIRPGAALTIRVRAELRQVYHASNETVLNIADVDDHSGDLEEFALAPDTAVALVTGTGPDTVHAWTAEVPLPPLSKDTVVAGRSYRVGPDPTWHGGAQKHANLHRDDGGLRTGDIVEVQSTRPNDPDVQVRFVDPVTGAHHQTYVNPACLDTHPVPTRDDLVAGRKYRVVRQPYWWSVDGTRVGYDWSTFPTVVTVVGLRSDVTAAVSRHDPDVAVAASVFAAGTYLDPECLDPVPVDA